jgi:hypothetical protein
MRCTEIIVCLLALIFLSCQSKNGKRIDIKYQNYAIETVAGPKWEDVINGKYPDFLVKSSITSENICDSIIRMVNSLKPMKKGIIPEECKPYMQCVIHFPDRHSSILILGDYYIILDGVAMMDNAVLVKIICRYSGYNHVNMH